MLHLIFYLVSVTIFMVLGFHSTSYWIIAVILLSIYTIFVGTIYNLTKSAPEKDIELGTIPAHNHPDNRDINLHHESILEEHEVRL